MTESSAYGLFLICIIIIMFALTALALLGISLICAWLIRRIVEIITGRRANLF